MTESAKPRRSTTAQTVGVLVVALSVIALSVVATLGFSGNLDLSSFGIGGSGENTYRNITFTDAQLACEEEARKDFGNRLKLITLDTASSRFDASSNRYRMYFKLSMLPRLGANRDIPVNFFLNCFVHGGRGKVTHFESVEDKEDSVRPIRENTRGPWGL